MRWPALMPIAESATERAVGTQGLVWGSEPMPHKWPPRGQSRDRPRASCTSSDRIDQRVQHHLAVVHAQPALEPESATFAHQFVDVAAHVVDLAHTARLGAEDSVVSL